MNRIRLHNLELNRNLTSGYKLFVPGSILAGVKNKLENRFPRKQAPVRLLRLSTLLAFLSIIGPPAIVHGKEPELNFSAKDQQTLQKDVVEFEKKLYSPYFVEGANGMSKSTADKAYGEGGKLMAAGQYKLALAQFDRAAERYKSKEERALYKNKDFLNFRISRVYLARALAQLKLNKGEEAEADVTDAITFCPDYAMPYKIRAGLSKAKGDRKGYLDDLAKASSLRSVPPFLEKDMGKLGMEGRLSISKDSTELLQRKLHSFWEERAKRYYKEGSAGAKKSKALEYYEKGRATRDEGLFDRALAQFDKAIAEYKKPAERALFTSDQYYKNSLAKCYQNRAYCLLNLQKFEPAIKDLNEAIKLEPEVQENYINRGKAYEHLGKKSEAEKDFEKAKTLKPSELEWSHPHRERGDRRHESGMNPSGMNLRDMTGKGAQAGAGKSAD